MTGVDSNVIMRALIQKAQRYRGLAAPNPVVAAAVIRDGQWVASGVHVRAGDPHAEVLALNQAGKLAKGATLYVTLEPCTHHGKTPPCCTAIIAAGIAHVVWAVNDPSPHVRRLPAESVLRAAGIRVTAGVLASDAQCLNPAFHRSDPNVPFITLKLAQSLDGKLALNTGDSAYLTSESARRYVHQIRHEVDAIMVGSETVWMDDPELTIRHGVAHAHAPAVIVASQDPSTPKKLLNTRLFSVDRPVYVATVSDTGQINSQRVNSRGDVGEVEALTALWPSPHVLVEGGAILADQLVQAGVVSELMVMIAPCVLGGNRGWGRFDSPPTLASRVQCRHTQIQHFDDTVMLTGWL
ncbi:riboflavin biosynthesis protein RibD [bacterium]|nr:riboflavin biosynthesis protein RibD [bacterium]|tara:strand:- start:90 stop:1148 length:1059 start_codon:yes stop_codon:yes gene_type:complete